jgi:hypothetical protein
MNTYEVKLSDGTTQTIQSIAAVAGDGGQLMFMEETSRGGKRLFLAFAPHAWVSVRMVS